MKRQTVLLVTIGAGLLATLYFVGAIPQDPDYFLFADSNTIAGIPNFQNVLSNLPFLIVGLAGLRLVINKPTLVSEQTRASWRIFFFGIALTAFGSGYFHLAPDNDTLVWDRLPMTIGFMSLIAIIIAEYFSAEMGRRSLLPLLLVGIGSVGYWAYTESIGAGDLRPYALVQFLPMILIPIVIFLRRARSDLSRYIAWMIVFYVAAKVAEQLDEQLFAVGQVVSGHTLKHLLAALAPASLLYGLMQRRDEDRGTPSR